MSDVKTTTVRTVKFLIRDDTHEVYDLEFLEKTPTFSQIEEMIAELELNLDSFKRQAEATFLMEDEQQRREKEEYERTKSYKI